MYKKTASIKDIYSIEELIEFLNTIPCLITARDRTRMMRAIYKDGKATILWSEQNGFRIFEKK